MDQQEHKELPGVIPLSEELQAYRQESSTSVMENKLKHMATGWSSKTQLCSTNKDNCWYSIDKEPTENQEKTKGKSSLCHQDAQVALDTTGINHHFCFLSYSQVEAFPLELEF